MSQPIIQNIQTNLQSSMNKSMIKTLPNFKDFSSLLPDPLKFIPIPNNQTRPGSTHVDEF